MSGWAGGTLLDILLCLPALMGRAGTDLVLVSEELLHSQLVPGSWCLRVAQPREGASTGMFNADIFLTSPFGSGFWD